ncbi:MAG: hypothetical protein COT14_03235 [Candidatus Diapherotrites archaeon CG08_land_8_20_14_0_20_30_16]|nr:MAG: hypothetical protein COT14_03235 [Candidatus Diapherotrites archaeon CG08_land_8_20_14_0_20_30_16]
MFEYLEHTADIKIRVKAKNEFEFFSDIVKSVNEAIFEAKPIKCDKHRELVLESGSIEQLIHDFIDEIVYIANYEHFASKLFSCNLEHKKEKYILTCSFVLCETKKEDYKIEVKAVSFNVLYKEDVKTKEKSCEFVLDI